MATNLLHSLADENPDLQKQIGCMTGILQLLDRRHMIASRRITQNRLPPPGTSQFNNDSMERDLHNSYNGQAADESDLKVFYKSAVEKHRISTESSRASFSSSCSSSLSSMECSKVAQPDASSFSRVIFPETTSRDPMNSQWGTNPINPSRHAAVFKGVVKDSMNREARGLSVQTTFKEDALTWSSKHKDSPRPLSVDQNPNVPIDLKESFRVIAELREAPWHFNGARESAAPAPWFPYDEREVNRLSFESRLELKELPRPSLDSRDGSLPRSNGHVSENVKDIPRSSGSQSRQASVVAKLMGLEALPDSDTLTGSQLASIKNSPVEEASHFIRPLKTKDLRLPIKGFHKPSRNSVREPISPLWKSHEMAMKPVSRSPNEPAPWKQTDWNTSLQNSVNKPPKVRKTTSGSSSSVYGEIEKRLKDLEFDQSGKDLRALKQILEAMQAKGLLETHKEEQPSNFVTHKNYELRDITANKNSRFENLKNPQKGGCSRKFESPIVIMRPAKLIEKHDINTTVVSMESLSMDAKKVVRKTRRAKVQTPKTDLMDTKTTCRAIKSSQPSLKPQKTVKESSSSSVKGTGSVSPRLQKKKLELERCPRPPTPSNSNRPRRQPSRPISETTSPGGRFKLRYPNRRPSEEQLSEVSNDSRSMSFQEDDISVHSDGNNAMDSDPLKKKSMLRLGEEVESLSELTTGAIEHQSPVSVLDVSESTADASPIKEEPNSPKYESVQDAIPDDSSSPGPISEINRKKLKSIDQLVQKLRRLNSTHDEERTDYIASLCDNTNPDHRYISEILLASGLLLRDLSSNSAQIQLHPSGHPINPKLFFVLEHTKAREVKAPYPKPNREKARRRLLFDSVNEILVQKLSVSGIISEPKAGSKRLARKTLTAQKLLKELCFEIEQLENKKPECPLLINENDSLKGILWEDVMDRSEGWNDFQGETPGLALDIERCIFKDLVKEVLIGESVGLRMRPGKCRQLFGK
ncbi:hypothetical protein SAY86_006481 [Trapa natans]|uniref:DUF4378 domain-containing protein n=1 Tax=Trapa natans TaxID=22666 RepID=A0AAN7QXN4_TRANT|nr:hypothetical protein SAY86_006481 [Trapa natans]